MEKLSGQRYIVTGGAGFIGSHIAEALVAQGKEVIVLDSLVAGTKENFAPWWKAGECIHIETDVRNLWGIKSAFSDFGPIDGVFHNAASKCTVCRDDPYRDLMTNAWGVRNVCEAALTMKQGNPLIHGPRPLPKIIHASTGSVMGGEPVSFYGASKLAGESYIRAFQEYYPAFRATVLRYYHVYGPRQNSGETGGVIPIFIKRILHGDPVVIYGTGEQIRHFTYVKDVVRANIMAMNEDTMNSGTFDVLSDVTVSIKDLAGLLYGIIGKEPDIQYAERRRGDIDRFIASNRAIKDAGMEFRGGFVEQLRETVEWYRGNA